MIFKFSLFYLFGEVWFLVYFKLRFFLLLSVKFTTEIPVLVQWMNSLYFWAGHLGTLSPHCTLTFHRQQHRTCFVSHTLLSAWSLTVKGVIIGLQPTCDGLIHILLLDTLYAQVLKTESKYSVRLKPKTETTEVYMYFLFWYYEFLHISVFLCETDSSGTNTTASNNLQFTHGVSIRSISLSFKCLYTYTLETLAPIKATFKNNKASSLWVTDHIRQLRGQFRGNMVWVEKYLT